MIYSISGDTSASMQMLRDQDRHAVHVRYLGLALLDLSDQFKGVDRDTLDRFLYLHETSKRQFLNGNTFRIGGLQNGLKHNLSSTVHQSSTKGSDKQYTRLLESFRQADKAIAADFFRQEGLLGPNEALEDNALVQKYLRIEHIANIVERGKSSIDKNLFNKKVLPAHIYFDEAKNDLDSARLALRLQYEYYNIEENGNTKKLVRNYMEYRLANFTHVLRVARLGRRLLKEQRDKFENVDPRILEEFLLLHSQSRVNTSQEFINRHGIGQRESLSSKLYQNYSIDFQNLSSGLTRENKTLIEQLARIDREVVIAFFRKKGLLGKKERIEDNALVKTYLHIQQIADLVDKGGSPVSEEEFGRKILPAHAFFARILNDSESASLAAILEHNYEQIVGGDTYIHNVPLLRLAMKRYNWDRATSSFKKYRGECLQIMTEHFLNSHIPTFSVR